MLIFGLIYTSVFLLSDIDMLYIWAKHELEMFKLTFGGRFSFLYRQRFLYKLIRFLAFIIGLVLFIIGQIFYLVFWWISFPPPAAYLSGLESYVLPYSNTFLPFMINYQIPYLLHILFQANIGHYWQKYIRKIRSKTYTMITRKIISDYFRRRRRPVEEYDIITASTWINAYNKRIPITVTQNELDDPCSICYEEIQKDLSQIRKFPCNHIFHTSCIDHWFLSQWHSLRLNWTCPLCFSDILDCK